MARRTIVACLLLLAVLGQAVEPQYVKHDYIKGNSLILTNTEEFVLGEVDNLRTNLEKQIEDVATNGTASAAVAIREAANAATNYTDSVVQEGVSTAKGYTDSSITGLRINSAEVVIPQSASDRGVTFVDTYGEDQNVAVALGRNAKAAVTPESAEAAPDNKIIRSVGVAIGAEADASNPANPLSHQAIAIGWHAQARASNAIAIGSGAQHPTEDADTGNATVANGSTAIAVGYDAKAKADSTIAIGRSAKATAANSVQLGQGVNEEAGSLQFLAWKLLNSSGQIPYERLSDATETAMEKGMARLLKPGNMTLDPYATNSVPIEPVLNGLSEIQYSVDTNEVVLVGGRDDEIDCLPPLGVRNYDILVSNLLTFYRQSEEGLVPLDPLDQFVLNFEYLEPTHKINYSVDSRCGNYDGGCGISITNAPCIIKVREPATNRLIVAVKPWSPADI